MVERVLVLSPNWLGDAVMALPALADIRRAYPDRALWVAARRSLARLFRSVDGVDEVIALSNEGGVRSLTRWAEDARRLAEAGASVAVVLPNSFSTAWVAWRARIPERWGYRADGRRLLLTRAVERPGGSRHHSEYYRHLVAALGITSGGPAARIVVGDQERAGAARLLAGEGCRADATLVGMAPGAAYGHAKRWPPDRYAALAVRLFEDAGATPVLVGSAGDRATGLEIERELARAGLERLDLATGRARWVNLVGRTDLTMAMAVTAMCRAFVSNDSGAMHLAAALGVPVTAIFGSTNEHETAPLPLAAFEEASGEPSAARRDTARPRHRVLTSAAWCRPCMLRECPIDHRCMTGISVATVLEAVLR